MPKFAPAINFDGEGFASTILAAKPTVKSATSRATRLPVPTALAFSNNTTSTPEADLGTGETTDQRQDLGPWRSSLLSPEGELGGERCSPPKAQTIRWTKGPVAGTPTCTCPGS